MLPKLKIQSHKIEFLTVFKFQQLTKYFPQALCISMHRLLIVSDEYLGRQACFGFSQFWIFYWFVTVSEMI